MNNLPDPVTTYIYKNQPRKIKMDDYSKQIAEDINMNDKEYLMQFGDEVFKNIDKTININDNSDSISVSATDKKGALSRLGDFARVNPEKIDFLFNEIPEHGTRSLRRGFYKLLPPFEVHKFEDGIVIWRADVLYNEVPGFTEVYKYACNIGLLCNIFAVSGNLTTGKFLHPRPNDKGAFFEKIMNHSIYVSSVKFIKCSDFNSINKEVLWFLL